jgi:hypothetical protein
VFLVLSEAGPSPTALGSDSTSQTAAAERFPYSRLGPPWPALKHPSWLSKGSVFVGNWEPLQWAYRKNWQEWGNARSGARAEQIHKEDRTEKTVVGLKQMGVNMVFTSFHKGFGIANEKFNMEEAAEYAKLLHKHGMKMAVYVSALLIYEDLYGEFPEAKDWHRIYYDGTPDTYMNDGYRYRAYLNHPGYMNYMKRVCELAVKAGADAIFFDTVRQTPENHHPLAERMFREYLKQKYPTDDGWFFRTGLHFRDYVKIPHYTDASTVEAFDQAIMQEYLQFKSQQITDFAAEVGTFIRSLNPETAIWFNTGGITGGNTVQLCSIDHARLLPWLDIYYTEERDYAGYSEDGGIISKIRTIKAGSRFDSVHTNATGQPPPVGERSLDPPRDDPRLRLAEAMAFNRLGLGNMGYGAGMVIRSFPETGRRYLNFYGKNFDELLAGCFPAADVAVLRTFASMAFNNFATHRETILAEQALIQAQVPFDMIFDQDLDSLGKYKVVVLAGQESLSEKQVEALRAWVRNGGGLVATANTSMFDDWRRQRDAFGLADVLGVERPSPATDKQVQHEFGKGRAAYIPKLVPKVAAPNRTAYTVKYWAPPRNAAELVRAVQWAGAGKLNWQISAPPFVAAEAYYQPARNRYILHLVNYDCRKHPQVDKVEIAWAFKNAAQFSKVTAYSPDEEKPLKLTATRTAGGAAFTVPRLGVYSVIVIEK